MEGADSSFLMDILKRICASLEIDISASLYNSYVVSADNSHAVHPNHPNKSDVSNMGYINKGILISRETGTMTDGMSSSIFKDICKEANVKYQDYVSRNYMTCGGTLSGLCTRHVSTTSIDIGIPQLAMHSANEVVGSDDTFSIYRIFKKFYSTSIRKDRGAFKLIYK
jgi:aspartyl aminopeptidase